MGYLWHGHYLSYFEQARTEWLRARGATYRGLEDQGTLLVVVETGLTFHRPGGYDDEVEVHTRLVEARGARLRFQYEVRRGRELLAKGFTVLASTDARGRPCRPPATLRALAAQAGLDPDGLAQEGLAQEGPGGKDPAASAVQERKSS